MNRGVYVLGMHRSGTSAAARLVNLLGIATCLADDLLAATPDNPRGHWESGSLAAFNDRLLDAIGCDWTCPPLLANGWSTDQSLADLRAEGRNLFLRVTPAAQWVWKDPRNCVTLPFWTASVSASPAVVLVDRSPLEIADSLTARNGFGKAYGLALWERYLRLCLEAIAGFPVFVTGYEELLDDPLAWCEQVLGFLSTEGFETVAPAEGDLLEFVDPGLRRQRSTPRELEADPALSSAQRALRHRLEELHGVQRTFSAGDLGDETPTTDALLAERRRTRAAERDLRAQYRELEDYTRRLAERVIVLEAEAPERG